MKFIPRILFGALLAIAFITNSASAELSGTREGWRIEKTAHGYADLVKRLEETVKANKMGLVTAASASTGAASQGVTIPGNRIVGVYRNDFARRMLEASIAAGIEAPIRFYITENADETATLSYKLPTTVFAPYFGEGGEPLRKLAEELDAVFARIADETVK